MKRWTLVLAVSLLGSEADAMELSSPEFPNGGVLSLSQVKCGGENISPSLQWSGEPAPTKSFALTVFDPDAHGGWWHWIVLDIPANVHRLSSGAGSGAGLPPGAIPGLNDFRQAAYGGPCPPPGSGVHHYQFTLWALPSANLPLNADAKPDSVGQYLASHALNKAELIGTYQR